MAEIYIPTEAYRRAVDALAAMTTGIGSDEIKIALGEVDNIWPRSIFGDAITARAMECHGEIKQPF